MTIHQLTLHLQQLQATSHEQEEITTNHPLRQILPAPWEATTVPGSANRNTKPVHNPWVPVKASLPIQQQSQSQSTRAEANAAPNTNNGAAAVAPGVIASGGSSSGSSSSSGQRDSKQYLAVSSASSIMSDGLSANSLASTAVSAMDTTSVIPPTITQMQPPPHPQSQSQTQSQPTNIPDLLFPRVGSYLLSTPAAVTTNPNRSPFIPATELLHGNQYHNNNSNNNNNRQPNSLHQQQQQQQQRYILQNADAIVPPLQFRQQQMQPLADAHKELKEVPRLVVSQPGHQRDMMRPDVHKRLATDPSITQQAAVKQPLALEQVRSQYLSEPDQHPIRWSLPSTSNPTATVTAAATAVPSFHENKLQFDSLTRLLNNSGIRV